MEEWRDITGFEGIYQVSNFGRVKRVLVSKGTPGGLLKPKYQHGYPCVRLCGNGSRHNLYYIHRLVARAFLGEPPDDKPEVNHVDGNRADSRLCNLEWCSAAYNVQDAKRREWLNIKPDGRGGMAMFDKYERK